MSISYNYAITHLSYMIAEVEFWDTEYENFSTHWNFYINRVKNKLMSKHHHKYIHGL